MLETGQKVRITGCENPNLNREGTVDTVYGRGNQKAIVKVPLPSGEIGTLLFDAEYPFSVQVVPIK